HPKSPLFAELRHIQQEGPSGMSMETGGYQTTRTELFHGYKRAQVFRKEAVTAKHIGSDYVVIIVDQRVFRRIIVQTLKNRAAVCSENLTVEFENAGKVGGRHGPQSRWSWERAWLGLQGFHPGQAVLVHESEFVIHQFAGWRRIQADRFHVLQKAKRLTAQK